LALAAACGGTLPDPQAPGAVVMRERCGGCHRLYAPETMTVEMWKFQVERMRTEFARRGVPWLAPGEEQALLEYLTSHAGSG
jgi:diheme cytochrome c